MKILSKLFLITLLLLNYGCGGGSTGTDSGGGSIKIKGVLKADTDPNYFKIAVLETGDQATTDSNGNFIIDTSKINSDLTLLITKENFENKVVLPNSNFVDSKGDKIISVSINVDTANDAVTIVSLYIENKNIIIETPSAPPPLHQTTQAATPKPTASAVLQTDPEENSYGSIEGSIISLNGVPIAGALIKLNKVVKPSFAYTNIEGKFKVPFFTDKSNITMQITYKDKDFTVKLPKLPFGKIRVNINLLLKTTSDIIDQKISSPFDPSKSGETRDSIQVIERKIY